ncbi:peptidoglycan-binding protein [Plantibacter sp. VKM Ac-2880]|uniref:peptidoglycan-binding protein n=1 Tax=Plantibacter sp. VKM Ac-2880 TaxID=2783827 RepID=UPI00188F9B05|nr:peptidoglycan-binding protein [Plantibacter sp. VKM Ac-2880]MBF4570067.1 peptidoglycan-binding protein [Plantibacter sp. VKM Ac-2880]
MHPTLDAEPDLHADDQPTERGPRRRGALIVSITVFALLLGGGAAFAVVQQNGSTAPSKAYTTVDTSTAKVERGDLFGISPTPGTIDYSDSRVIGAGASGTVTATAPVGSQVSLGNGLYWIDNVPVLLLHGPLPAWRAFGTGMTNGPDVLQLETSLAGLGYFDRTPDLEFAESTERAVKRWQQALGLGQTGRLELGSVVFMTGDVRIGFIAAAIGTQIGQGGPLLTVTSLNKQIEVDLKTSDQRLAVPGGAVTISLPGGTSTTGTVITVGASTEREANGQKSIVIPVSVSLDEPAATATLQRSSVTVGFPSERRDDVLSVPVEALIALDAERYGVEIVAGDGTTNRVPVTTGLFADGKVEISGDGVAAGDDVVVPEA